MENCVRSPIPVGACQRRSVSAFIGLSSRRPRRIHPHGIELVRASTLGEAVAAVDLLSAGGAC
ncbi:MAG: hypothetical protein Ct9H300mP12_01550 [Acidimicrobiales bacterium]|nr:MAG: hypothetical protein Ct9H300mP12_01550 [Acidimicrobiales bacterium]